MTKETYNIDNIVDNMHYYTVCSRLSTNLIKIGYDVNTSSVSVKDHPYDITKCVWKDALEIHKTQVQYLTTVLDQLNIDYTITTEYGKKTFPLIVFDNAKKDFRLLLKNIHLVPVLEIREF